MKTHFSMCEPRSGLLSFCTCTYAWQPQTLKWDTSGFFLCHRVYGVVPFRVEVAHLFLTCTKAASASPRIAQVTQIPATGQLFHPGWCDWLALPLHSAGDDSWLCAFSPHLQLKCHAG